jgi:hypothetical protein
VAFDIPVNEKSPSTRDVQGLYCQDENFQKITPLPTAVSSCLRNVALYKTTGAFAGLLPIRQNRIRLHVAQYIYQKK